MTFFPSSITPSQLSLTKEYKGEALSVCKIEILGGRFMELQRAMISEEFGWQVMASTSTHP